MQKLSNSGSLKATRWSFFSETRFDLGVNRSNFVVITSLQFLFVYMWFLIIQHILKIIFTTTIQLFQTPSLYFLDPKLWDIIFFDLTRVLQLLSSWPILIRVSMPPIHEQLKACVPSLSFHFYKIIPAIFLQIINFKLRLHRIKEIWDL